MIRGQSTAGRARVGRDRLAAGDGYTVSTTNGLASLAVNPNYPTVAAYTTQTVVSDQSPGVFTIELSEPSPYDTTVSYAMGGTPAAPTGQSLYGGPVIGQVVIPAGDTTAQVTGCGPSRRRHGHVLGFRGGATAAGNPGAILYEPGVTAAAVVFTDNTPELTVSDAIANEGDSETFRVLASHPLLLDRSGHGAVYFG